MNWKRFFAAVFALLVVLSLGSTRVNAQKSTTGDIAGVVTDPSGATVPGAKVSLKDETKGNTQESTTNKDGVYHFYLLSPGPYTVTVTATGFQSFSRHSNVSSRANCDAERANDFGRSDDERDGDGSGASDSDGKWRHFNVLVTAADFQRSEPWQRPERDRATCARRGRQLARWLRQRRGVRLAGDFEPLHDGRNGRQRPIPELEQLWRVQPASRFQ